MKILNENIIFEPGENLSRLVVIAELAPSAWDPAAQYNAIARSFVLIVDARSRTLKLEAIQSEGLLLSGYKPPAGMTVLKSSSTG